MVDSKGNTDRSQRIFTVFVNEAPLRRDSRCRIRWARDPSVEEGEEVGGERCWQQLYPYAFPSAGRPRKPDTGNGQPPNRDGVLSGPRRLLGSAAGGLTVGSRSFRRPRTRRRLRRADGRGSCRSLGRPTRTRRNCRRSSSRSRPSLARSPSRCRTRSSWWRTLRALCKDRFRNCLQR